MIKDIQSHTIISDSGRVADNFVGERRDCTVRCVAEAYAVTYATAHAACAKAGRRPKKGFYFAPAVSCNRFGSLGTSFELPRFTNRRLGSVMEDLASYPGKYMVLVRHHVFAVVDGKIKDTFVSRPGTIVRRVWKVQPLAERPGRVCRVETPSPLQRSINRLTREVTPEEAAKIRFDYVFNFDPKNK